MWKNFFLLVTEIFRTHLMKSVRRVRACGVQDLHSLNGRRFYLFPFTVMIFRNTFALWYPGVLQIFIIFIQQQTKFPKNAFRLQFPAWLTRIFFVKGCMINDKCLRQCKKGDGWVADFCQMASVSRRKAHNMYIVCYGCFRNNTGGNRGMFRQITGAIRWWKWCSAWLAL